MSVKKAPSVPSQPAPPARFELDEIERRQDEILAALDALNERILLVLRENGVAVQTIPFQQPAKADAPAAGERAA